MKAKAMKDFFPFFFPPHSLCRARLFARAILSQEAEKKKERTGVAAAGFLGGFLEAKKTKIHCKEVLKKKTHRS
jgi:hypothetical protein